MTVELVAAVKARLGRELVLLHRVLLGADLPEHREEGRAETSNGLR